MKIIFPVVLFFIFSVVSCGDANSTSNLIHVQPDDKSKTRDEISHDSATEIPDEVDEANRDLTDISEATKDSSTDAEETVDSVLDEANDENLEADDEVDANEIEKDVDMVETSDDDQLPEEEENTPDVDETIYDESDETESSANDSDNENSDNENTTYSAVEHLVDDELITALYNIIEPPHTPLGYSGARDKMYSVIDVNNNFIECYYTGEKVTPDGSSTPGSFNTEHSWPQSQFSKREPARGDIHHLFPTDSGTNSGRGSYDFGEVTTPSTSYCGPDSCSYRGNSSAVGALIFDVRPERRGDVARAHFYMVARYKHSTAIPIDDSNKTSYGCKDSDKCIDDNEEVILRKWHIEDPVDDMEMERNNRIELYQGNRNPFVDRPDFVEKISNF